MKSTGKKILEWLLGITLLMILAASLPLFYMAFLAMALLLPPVLFIDNLREHWQEKTLAATTILKDAFTIFIYLPFFLLTVTAVLRSLVLLVFSFFPPVLIKFHELHDDLFYHFFIPRFGDLFPYWLDVIWGLIAVIVILIMSIRDSWHRSLMVRQIEILPTSKIKSAAIGLVELKGKAIPLEKTEKGPIIRSWLNVSDDGVSSCSIANPFYLDDGTGRVLVDPKDCDVNAEDRIFDMTMHHAILTSYTPEKGFPEGRLMPGDETYVLGNLQINRDPDYPEDKVIITPQRSSFLHPRFYDLFFVSNKSEEELLSAFQNSIKRGWGGVTLMLFLIGWMAIYAWLNLAQIEALDTGAGPLLFRLVTPATDMERSVTVDGIGTNATAYWLQEIKSGSLHTDDIMYALKEQRLTHLAIPSLVLQARDIDSLTFAIAHKWHVKLGKYPRGLWGVQFFSEEHVQTNIQKYNNEAFVYRVILNYQQGQLTASWKAWFSPFRSKHLTLKQKQVEFSLRHVETKQSYLRAILVEAGWNSGDDTLLFESLPPGKYEFQAYVRRIYSNGAKDKGSRIGGTFIVILGH